MTSVGEVKTFIDLPYYGDHLYTFTEMFYANDEFAYLFAFPSRSGRNGYDIIKIEDGSDSLQYISSITSKNEGEQMNINVSNVYQDKFLFIGGSVFDENDPSSTARNLFCFDVDEIGLSFDPVSVSESQIAQMFEIFPNPASKMINVNCSGFSLEGDLEIIIYTGLGQRLFTTKTFTTHNKLDLTSLDNGMYVLQVVNSNSDILKTEKVIVQRN